MLRIEICGMTNLDDALYASELGADALGFVFYKGSPRYITPEVAGGIIRALPPFVTPVGVFVDAEEDEVMEAVAMSGVRMLQFHGSERPGFCGLFGMQYLKAFRVRDLESLDGLKEYGDASAYLLDAYSESEFGGTGVSFNWDAAVYAKRFGRIILAGGLTPENVALAVEKIAPYAVDVATGVETEKGKKDRDKLKKFIHECRRINVT